MSDGQHRDRTDDLDDDAATMVLAFRRRVQAGSRNAARAMDVADVDRHPDLLTARYLGLPTTSRMDRGLAGSLAETIAAEVERRARP